jgi:hypothetical protein
LNYQRPEVTLSQKRRGVVMQIPISRLTRRANHRHIVIIADIVKLAPVNRPRAFSFAADAIRREVSNYPTGCIAFFL